MNSANRVHRKFLNIPTRVSILGKEMPNNSHLRELKVALLVFVITLTGLILPFAASSSTSQFIVVNTGQIEMDGVTARSGWWWDIQAAVNFVSRNYGVGNVWIPAGRWMFINSSETMSNGRGKVNVPAGINIFGVRTQRDSNGQVVEPWETILYLPVNIGVYPPVNYPPQWFAIQGSNDPNKPTRISDIMFEGYRATHNESNRITHALGITAVANFRLDHCYILDLGAGPVIEHSSGVIDHCRMVNTHGAPCNSGGGLEGSEVYYGVAVAADFSSNPPWETNIYNVIGKYTWYSVYIEDCFFSKFRHCVASNNGAHYVVRNCTFDGDWGFFTLDAHGRYTNVGTRAVEVYNCTFKNKDQSNVPNWSSMAQIRGGGGVWYNNRDDGSYDQMIRIWLDGPAFPTGKDGVHDLYIWNNTRMDGTTPSSATVTSEGPVKNVDWFLNAPPTPSSPGATDGYEPYQYPHPLALEP